MKAESDLLQDHPTISITLTRDSVCAGDDADAPHEKTADVPSFLDPTTFANAISAGYLASVAGVGHSWTCTLNNIPIAKITTQSIHPLVPKCTFSKVNRAHFTYHSATY